jgi:hypothetical protein
MAFPDPLDQPARTIMATFMRTSRETIIVSDDRSGRTSAYRHPTVREAATIQGFPITYQLWGSSLSQRYKLIGNAVPAPAGLRHRLIDPDGMPRIEGYIDRDAMPAERVLNRDPELAPDLTQAKLPGPTRSFPATRRFRDHLPGSRVPGYRVDLDNRGDGDDWVRWVAKLYVGSGKSTRSQTVDLATAKAALLDVRRPGPLAYRREGGTGHRGPRRDGGAVRARRAGSLQAAHTRTIEGTTPLQMLDQIGAEVDDALHRFELALRSTWRCLPSCTRRGDGARIPVRTLVSLAAVAAAAEATEAEIKGLAQEGLGHTRAGDLSPHRTRIGERALLAPRVRSAHVGRQLEEPAEHVRAARRDPGS